MSACVFVFAVLVGSARADQAAAALYVRTDSDQTTVVSPHVRANKRLGEASSVDVTYAADIWSSASIDIRASASVLPVTEQRDELNFALGHEWEDLRLRAAYRFSTEHDYTSHGATLGAAFDFASKASTLELSLRVFGDTVGRAGDASFARGLTTFDGVLSFTQVIDRMMFAQLTYELAFNSGYQASPYRFVGFGPQATGFGCKGAFTCLPERTPDARARHALAVLARRALGADLSLGLTYRFYFDDWSLSSHTVLGELGWNLGERTLLSARYRFYTQGAVAFYQRRYAALTSPEQYRTRDRELSQLTYHRAGAELEHGFDVGVGKLIGSLAVSGNLYQYADFEGLNQVVALELSAALLLEI